MALASASLCSLGSWTCQHDTNAEPCFSPPVELPQHNRSMEMFLFCNQVEHSRAARRSTQRASHTRHVQATRTLANGMTLTFCSCERANRRMLTTSCVRRACIVLACIHCDVCQCPPDPTVTSPPDFDTLAPRVTKPQSIWRPTRSIWHLHRAQRAQCISHIPCNRATQPALANHRLHLRRLQALDALGSHSHRARRARCILSLQRCLILHLTTRDLRKSCAQVPLGITGRVIQHMHECKAQGAVLAVTSMVGSASGRTKGRLPGRSGVNCVAHLQCVRGAAGAVHAVVQ